MAKHSSDSRGLAVRKRKSILVDQRKLDAAKITLGASTETATIDLALDLVVFRTEVFEALDRIAAEGAAENSTAALWQNDLLLAHTARERGWRVITRDKDFSRIRSQIKGLRVESPFPRRPL